LIESDFNPEEAAVMLDEAGVTDSDGDGIREFEGENTNFEILCDVNNPVEVRSTELIVGWLEDVGISASQNCLDIDTEVTLIWPNFVSIPNPDYDMAIWGWSSGTQFQRRFLRFLAGCDFGDIAWGNLSGLCDPELDALLEEFAVNPDPVRQEELNSEIQTRFAEFLPYIPLMSPGGNFAYRPQNFDNWQYMRGTGIMTVWSFLPPEAAASGE
jgi:peptide/nickel transport system substrate-binding protein